MKFSKSIAYYLMVFCFALLIHLGVLAWMIPNAGVPGMVRSMARDLELWLPFIEGAKNGATPFFEIGRGYPHGAAAFYWLLAWLVPTASMNSFLWVHGIVMTLFRLFNGFLLIQLTKNTPEIRTKIILFVYLFIPTGLVVGLFRFEPVVTLFVLLGFWYYKRSNDFFASISWWIAVVIKWFPVLLFFAYLVEFFTQDKNQIVETLKKISAKKKLLSFIGLTIVTLLGLQYGVGLRYTSLSSMLDQMLFNRPLHLDTVYGVLELWVGRVYFERFAFVLSGILVIVVGLIRPKTRFDVKFCAMCLAAFAVNKVYSSHYHLWFYPIFLVMLCGVSQRQWIIGLLAFYVLEVVNFLTYPVLFVQTHFELSQIAPYAASWHGGIWSLLFSFAVFLRSVIALAFIILLFRFKPLVPMRFKDDCEKERSVT